MFTDFVDFVVRFANYVKILKGEGSSSGKRIAVKGESDHRHTRTHLLAINLYISLKTNNELHNIREVFLGNFDKITRYELEPRLSILSIP